MKHVGSSKSTIEGNQRKELKCGFLEGLNSKKEKIDKKLSQIFKQNFKIFRCQVDGLVRTQAQHAQQ
jgi:hypothetical protein